MLPEWFVLTSLAILGAIWGSFVAALCSRWPKGESVAKGRSSCDQCGRQIAFYDLVPVISFLLLKGRCRTCQSRIDPMSVGIELAAILIGTLPALLLSQPQTLAAAMFGWLLLPLIVLDQRHLWLPDPLVFVLAAFGFLVGPLLTPDLIPTDRILGLIGGFLSLEALRIAYRRFRHLDGMGAGDPKLFGALGIWLGWQALPVTLLAATLIGFVSILAMHLATDVKRAEFPLGVYLAVAAFGTALFC
jgi:leader peptidase (prepilin peptidase) / N-methyltransferase